MSVCSNKDAQGALDLQRPSRVMRKCCMLSDKTSCLNTAQMDEPLFVLKASDVLAPRIVDAWAQAARGVGVSEEKIQAALDTAEAMRTWHQTHGHKIPD